MTKTQWSLWLSKYEKVLGGRKRKKRIVIEETKRVLGPGLCLHVGGEIGTASHGQFPTSPFTWAQNNMIQGKRVCTCIKHLIRKNWSQICLMCWKRAEVTLTHLVRT